MRWTPAEGSPSPAATMGRRRLSLPPTPLSTPLQTMYGLPPSVPSFAPLGSHPLRQRASQPSLLLLRTSSPQLLRRANDSMGALSRPRLSQPDLYHPIANPGAPSSPPVRAFYTPPHSAYFEQMPAPYQGRIRALPSAPPMPRSAQLPRRYLKRANQSDLSVRFQRHSEQSIRTEDSPPAREVVVDPVYLALKQATGKYGRRGSSAHPDSNASNTPSPRNLSQVSLQDSGYADMHTSSPPNPMLGSTPQLDNTGSTGGRRRAPRLNKQMKSLSLDCAEMPPRIAAVQAQSRGSPFRGRLAPGPRGSSEFSDWERSCSPAHSGRTSRRSSTCASESSSRRAYVSDGIGVGYIVIHEYVSNTGVALTLGERIRVIDNGDPEWLHGFIVADRTERLLTFPATCVAAVQTGEQPMRVMQNVHIPEQKLRLYRDQVVFAQADSIREGRVTVRTEHNALVACPLTHLGLL